MSGMTTGVVISQRRHSSITAVACLKRPRRRRFRFYRRCLSAPVTLSASLRDWLTLSVANMCAGECPAVRLPPGFRMIDALRNALMRHQQCSLAERRCAVLKSSDSVNVPGRRLCSPDVAELRTPLHPPQEPETYGPSFVEWRYIVARRSPP